MRVVEPTAEAFGGLRNTTFTDAAWPALGAALDALFDASQAEFSLAIGTDDREWTSAVAEALCAVEAFLAFEPSPPDANANVDRGGNSSLTGERGVSVGSSSGVGERLSLLLELILGHASLKHARPLERATALVTWLLLHSSIGSPRSDALGTGGFDGSFCKASDALAVDTIAHDTLASDALARCLSGPSHTNRLKLRATLLLKRAFHHSLELSTQPPMGSCWPMRALEAVLRPLRRAAAPPAAANGGAALAPTLLMTSAADAAVLVIAECCRRTAAQLPSQLPASRWLHEPPWWLGRLSDWRQGEPVRARLFAAATEEMGATIAGVNDAAHLNFAAATVDATAAVVAAAAVDASAARWTVADAHLWRDAAPLLLCDAGAASPRQLAERMRRWLDVLDPHGASHINRGQTHRGKTATSQVETIEKLRSSLVSIGLQAAALPLPRRAAVLSDGAARLYPAVAAQCALCAGATLPLALLQALLPSMLKKAGKAGEGGEVVSLEQEASILLQPVLNALSTTGSISESFVSIAVEFAALYPESILPDLAAKLAAPLARQRANALMIIERLCDGSAATSVQGAGLSTAVAQSLACALMPRLGDCSLSLRRRAAALFARLDPAFALPRLIALLQSVERGNPEMRSAVEEALASALKGGTDATAAASALMDAMRDVLAPPSGGTVTAAGKGDTAKAAPSAPHPGRIGPPRAGDEARDEAGDGRGDGRGVECNEKESDEDGASAAGAALESRLLRATERWATELKAAEWPPVLRVVATKFFAAADDTSCLRLLKRLVALPSSHAHLPMLVPLALQRLARARPEADWGAQQGGAQQGRAQQGGAQQGGAQKGGAHLDKGGGHPNTFAAPPRETAADVGAGEALMQLRPLLLLSLLPESAWVGLSPERSREGPLEVHEGASAMKDSTLAAPEGAAWRSHVPMLRSSLHAVVCDDSALGEVRKLATSLLARLPPDADFRLALATVRRLLGNTAETAEAAAADVDDKKIDTARALEGKLALYYVCVAVGLHPSAARAAERHVDLLLDATSVGMGGDPNAGKGAQPSVQPELAVSLQAGSMELLSRLVYASLVPVESKRISAPAKSKMPPAPAGDVLEAMLIRSERSEVGALQTLAAAASMVHARSGARATASFAARVLPRLLPCTGVAAGLVIFGFAFQSSPHLDVTTLHALLLRAIEGCRGGEAAERLNALKLLGVVLASGSDEEVWGGEDCATQLLLEAVKMLESLATIDASREVRRLAEKLKQVALGLAE
jgi:hypothetical protein